MKKLKILILLIILLLTNKSSIASEFEIKTNIKWWEYKNVWEVYLNSNQKNIKIFYYLDDEWRFDNIKEFNWNPIILKKDTTINFFSAIDEINSTTIQQEKFTFKYPENIKLWYLNWKIFIENYQNEIIDLWYRKIYWDNISLVIPKNYYINPWEKFEVFYSMKDLETLNLYSPDDKINKKFQFKNITIKNNETLKNENDKINIDKEIKNDLKEEEKNIEMINLSEILLNIKSSSLEYKNLYKDPTNDKNNKYSLLIWLIISIFIITIHNFFVNTREKKLKNIKKKWNKNFTF